MPPTRLDSIREDLQAELEAVDAECGRLKAELEAAEKERQAIKTALAALGGRGPQAAKKPTVTRTIVIEAMERLLQGNGSLMPAEELEFGTKERLTAEGFNLTGFSRRFQEALEEGRFETTPEGIAFAEAAVTAGSRSVR